jgi:conjugal transfer mating pair stabilization protein TraG
MVFTGLLVLVLAIVLEACTQTMPQKIDPAAYTPILNTIAKGESEGNYNAYFGNAANATIRFTDMSVGEVLAWQQEYVHSGSPSSAVGRYQIIRPTLTGLVQELGLDPAVRFDKTLQDRLAIALLERRGSEAYVGQKLSREQFAANLAREWAALPKVIGDNPEQSYYAGDGLNASRVSIGAV